MMLQDLGHHQIGRGPSVRRSKQSSMDTRIFQNLLLLVHVASDLTVGARLD